MGFFSRFVTKRPDVTLAQAEEAFDASLRILQLDLCQNLCDIYCLQMDVKVARALAAQVVNFLKGEDIQEVAHGSDEPLCSRLMAVLPQVPQRAEECMRTDRQTRELIVATLRMKSIVNFGKYGEAWLHSPAQVQIQRLLANYGQEFTEEIKPVTYVELVARYHAVKRLA